MSRWGSMVEEDEETSKFPPWVQENASVHQWHINTTPNDMHFLEMPPPSPKLKWRGNESYSEIIMNIMHGFGDYDNESNEKTAKLIEDYIVVQWLQIFWKQGEFNMNLLSSKYKSLIREYETNWKRAEMLKWQADPSLMYDDFQQDNIFEITQLEEFVNFMPGDDHESEQLEKKEQAMLNDEWK